jgi:hypothetical protein
MLSQAIQVGAHTKRETVVFDITVDFDVNTLAPHLVTGASQAVMHASLSSRL